MLRLAIFTVPVILGWALDLLFGDPHWLWHPVRLMGKFIRTLENHLYRQEDSDRKKFYKGLLLSVSVIAVTAAVSGLIVFVFWKIHPYAGALAEGVMCYQLIAVKALKDLVTGGLNAQGEPVDPSPTEGLEYFQIHTVRIALHGNFRVLSQIKAFGDQPQQLPQPLFPIKTGCTAAKINGVNLPASGLRGGFLEMGQ